MSLCLELTQDLPSEQELNRWFGEPIKAISVPTSIFIFNKKGFPVLSTAHQAVVQRLYKVSCHGSLFYLLVLTVTVFKQLTLCIIIVYNNTI